jgi:hypothetical protein
MRTPSLEFMKTGNIRGCTEKKGKHDKGVWEEWELRNTLRKLGTYEKGKMRAWRRQGIVNGYTNAIEVYQHVAT